MKKLSTLLLLFCALSTIAQNKLTIRNSETGEEMTINVPTGLVISNGHIDEDGNEVITDTLYADTVADWNDEVCDTVVLSDYKCDTFTAWLYPNDTEEDSFHDMPGSKTIFTSDYFSGATFGIAYFPVAFTEQMFLSLCNESSSWGTAGMTPVGNVEEMEKYGRTFRAHQFEDSVYVMNTLYWSNADYSIFILEKNVKGDCSCSTLCDSIEWLLPEKSHLTKKERFDRLSKMISDGLSDREQRVELSMTKKTITIAMHNMQPWNREEKYHQKGLKVVSRLATTIALFKECAEQGYTFRYQTYDNDGKQLCDCPFTAKDIVWDIKF